VGIGQDHSGARGGGVEEEVRRPRVVLVMVECVCADGDVPALELGAEQWAQDLRFRRVMRAAETTDARAVVVDATLDVLGEAFRIVGDGLRQGTET